nr:hypothetical protein [Tanacetum cinerariifolium]
MPLGDHAAHWANYLGELVRELPLHYPSWRKMPPEQKAGVVAKIGGQQGYWASLRIEPDLISRIKEAQKEDSEIWTRQDPKPFLKGNHGYERPRPEGAEGRAHYRYWGQLSVYVYFIITQIDLRQHMEPPDWTEINAGIQQHLKKAYNTDKAAFKAKHLVIDPTTGTYNVDKIRPARPENITASEQNLAKSTVISRQESRSLARLRDEMRQTSTTQEYPSLIDTFFEAHTVNGEFLQDEDQPQATTILSTLAHESTLNNLHKKVDSMMSLFKSDSKYLDMFSQLDSGGASGSGGCRDEKEGANHQDDEDKDGDGDT